MVATSDDARALALAPDPEPAVGGFYVAAGDLDSYVLDLAARGIAVRTLVREDVPLEVAFRELAT